MVYGAINFTEVSIWDLLSTVKFSDFISLSIRGYKNGQKNQLLNKVNFTASYTRDMVLKCLPEPTYDLNMFHKMYQVLSLPDKLTMH